MVTAQVKTEGGQSLQPSQPTPLRLQLLSYVTDSSIQSFGNYPKFSQTPHKIFTKPCRM